MGKHKYYLPTIPTHQYKPLYPLTFQFHLQFFQMNTKYIEIL